MARRKLVTKIVTPIKVSLAHKGNNKDSSKAIALLLQFKIGQHKLAQCNQLVLAKHNLSENLRVFLRGQKINNRLDLKVNQADLSPLDKDLSSLDHSSRKAA